MKKANLILIYLCLLALIAACDKEVVIDKVPDIISKYDPGKPVSVEQIIPTYGVIDETFIINGNFSGELSDMKVYFGLKRAVLTATNGGSITGLVPKQPEGYNQISVVTATDSLAPTDIIFKYKQSRSVKTISGKLGNDKWMDDADYANADVSAVTYGEVHYVATVAGQKNDNVFMVETGWGNRLFLLSLDDNKVQKLETPEKLNSLAVPSTRDKFYATKYWGGDRPIYVYEKEEGWAFRSVGIVIKEDDFFNSKSPSMTFAEDDNLIYILDNEGRIAEVDLSDKSYKIYTADNKKPANINEDNFGGYITGDLPSNTGDWEDSYICYSKYHHCFFVSYTREDAIYKYVKNGDGSWSSTLYAGHNGQGFSAGDRLIDAQFNRPHGMTVNEDGEIFVCNKDGHFICKIAGDMVELVAGIPGKTDPLENGDPLESTFNNPRNLAIDFEGNYYIAGGNDRTVRKLSIE
jgi:hypothetical protein